MNEYIYERPELLAKIMRDGWNIHIDWFKTWSDSNHVVGWRYRCFECNGYLGDDDNYCSNCGARVMK